MMTAPTSIKPHTGQASSMRTNSKLLSAEARSAYLMLTPSFIGIGIFLLVPLFAAVVLSFTDWNLIAPAKWVGTANYQQLAGDFSFWNSLLVTFIFTALALPGSIIIGLLIALALNQRLPGSRFMQICFLLPWLAAPLTLGIIWSWLLAPRTGLINILLGTNIAWISSEAFALPSIAFVYIWQNSGYISLFFLAGLRAIPKEIFEAAQIDGAGAFRRLISITLPLLRPTTFFVCVTSFISAFQVYDLIYGLTGGNPGYPGGTTDVITARIYETAFTYPRIGMAAAMAVVLTLAILTAVFLQRHYFKPRITSEISGMQ
ncbi:sugar ABC transporter permease [Arcanobacterium hippocoleae]